MADNYLERRREDYERHKAEWLKKKRYTDLLLAVKKKKDTPIEEK